MTRLRFDGAAKGTIEQVEVEITNAVVAGGRHLFVQPVLIGAAERLWLTIGAPLADTTCSVAAQAWRFEEIEPQWDRLILRFSIDGRPSQDAPLGALGRPRDLIVCWSGSKRLAVGVALFCGAPPSAESLRPGQTIDATLEDPVLGRTLAHGYHVQSLPIVS
jgi:Protein of unknown function (DUF2848)